MSEKRIMRAVRSGDRERIRETFAEVYDSYVRLVYFIVSRYVRDTHAAEDVTEDVFVSFFETLLYVKSIDDVKYYLTVAAKNKAADYLARESNRTALGDSYGEIHTDSVSVEESVLASCSYAEVVGKLRRYLPSSDVDIIVARAVMCESFAEISERMKMPKNTVIARYYRAIKRIRKYWRNIQ